MRLGSDEVEYRDPSVKTFAYWQRIADRLEPMDLDEPGMAVEMDEGMDLECVFNTKKRGAVDEICVFRSRKRIRPEFDVDELFSGFV